VDSNTGTQISLNPLQAFQSQITGKVKLQTPSNVTRIGRCVKQFDTRDPSQPIQQITYYQAGIGTQNLEDKVLGGATGFGLAEHIREAYQFIAANFNHDAIDADGDNTIGDEIYLTGFSRGAFTARSIASFINDIGLLTHKGLMHFYTIFIDWENQQKKGWKVPDEKDPFSGHSRPEYNLFDPIAKKRYVDELVKLGMTKTGVRVKAVAVWDTVGSLGIPRLGWLEIHKEAHNSLDYAFVDTSVPECVSHAIHAISLDENRKPFSPTIWELPTPVHGQTLTQVWFSGAHADVGGSYDDTRAADITLIWMISQLSKLGLEFDKGILKEQLFEPEGKEHWGCGPIHNEFKGIYKLSESLTRTPDSYLRYDHYTGLPRVPSEPLEKTYEQVHPSVRVRWGLKGKDHEGKNYASPALKGWTLEGRPQTTNGKTNGDGVNGTAAQAQKIREGQSGFAWKKGQKKLPEAQISDLEWELITAFRPDISEKFLSIVPGN
jgi:uncharacterized protein (DUF2235 family)